MAGQTPAGPVSPFTGAVFKHYYKRLSCHLESKSELHSTIDLMFFLGRLLHNMQFPIKGCVNKFKRVPPTNERFLSMGFSALHGFAAVVAE